VGDTLDPLIFMSNSTHLVNFPCDKKEWPWYMTIGIVSSKICQLPEMAGVVIVALLSIPIKNSNIPPK